MIRGRPRGRRTRADSWTEIGRASCRDRVRISVRRHTRWPRDWSSDVCSSDLQGAPKGRSRDLVATRVQRQLAHLLSHSGDYLDAATAAEATVRNASRVNDPWEAAWATYTGGFVD